MITVRDKDIELQCWVLRYLSKLEMSQGGGAAGSMDPLKLSCFEFIS